MSLITRCPSCETLFKVVPDQLRISDGWVRCGQCEEVFDASRHLLSEAYPSTIIMDSAPAPLKEEAGADIADFLDSLSPVAEPDVAEAQPGFIPDELAPTQILDDPYVSNSTSDNTPDIESSADFDIDEGAAVLNSDNQDNAAKVVQHDDEEVDSSWYPEYESEPLEEIVATKEESVRTDDLEARHEVPLTKELEEIVARRSQHAPLWEQADQRGTGANLKPDPVAANDAPSPDSEPVPSELSFMQGFGSRSVWRKPLVRLGLSVVALVLLAVLCVQVTIQERDRMVALAPAVQPWVAAVCNVANCSISPLRQIESIVIESSSFAKTRGEIYRFNFVIRNAAAVALAMPAVELALTDPQNRPVIRRVFLPADFGADLTSLAPGSEWPGSLAISVKLNGETERISGYRVLAFYP